MNTMNTAEALNTIREVLSRMDPAERERAMKFLRWYCSGWLKVDANAGVQGIRYNVESGQITICILNEDDTEGLIKGFLGIERRQWME